MRNGTQTFRWSLTVAVVSLAGCREAPTEPADTMAGVDAVASAPAPPGGLPKIAFSTYHGAKTSQLWTVNSNGTGLKQVTQAPYHDGVRNSTELFTVSWSPAGPSRIAFGLMFETRDYYHVRPMLISPDGTGLLWLTPPDVEGALFRWSPNGTKIAFSGGDTTNAPRFQISVMNADGSGLLTLVQDEKFASPPDWTPDGSRIVYYRETDFLWTLESERGIWSVTPDGTQWTKLVGVAAGKTRYRMVRISPDGTRLAICKAANGPQGQATVLIMNTNGTGQVSFALHCDRTLEWSPNGLRVLTVSNGHVYSVSPDGLEGEQLTTGGDVSIARWSATGTSIAFTRWNGRIWVMKADGSSEKPITGDSLSVQDLSWSR